MVMVNAGTVQCLWVVMFFSMMMLMKIQGLGVSLTLIESAVAKGAVCLDGSAPAYQFDKGVGRGANNWLVHLQGGGWCDTLESCINRRTSPLGSSTLMMQNNFTGIMSNKKEFNPNFYNWNRILVRYCDGSSFTGDVEKVDPVTKLHFRGSRVFDAVIEELLAKGLKNASNALLSGCSAGGLSSILHCDKFRGLLPKSVNVKCVADGGYFLHKKDGSGGYDLARKFARTIELHGSAKNLPQPCTSKMKSSLCFFPQYITPKIQTPLFIINSAFDPYQVRDLLATRESSPGGSWFQCQFDINKCSTNQLKSLRDFKTQFYEEILKGLRSKTKSFRGMFINTCHTHCQSQFQDKWLGNPTSKIDNKSISAAVGDWFFERSASGSAFKHMDNKHRLPHWCVFDPLEPNPKNNFTWPLGS